VLGGGGDHLNAVISRITFIGSTVIYLTKYYGQYFLILHTELHNKVRHVVPNKAQKANFSVGWVFGPKDLLLLALFNFMYTQISVKIKFVEHHLRVSHYNVCNC
jgi:hypothetical protein